MAPGNDESFKRRVKEGNLNKNLFNYYKLHYTMTTERQFWIEYFVHLISLQNSLKALQVPYLFYNATSALDDNDIYHNLRQQIDTRRWIGNILKHEHTYIRQLQAAGFEYPEWSDADHYGEDGHAWWAKRLIEYIYEHNL